MRLAIISVTTALLGLAALSLEEAKAADCSGLYATQFHRMVELLRALNKVHGCDPHDKAGIREFEALMREADSTQAILRRSCAADKPRLEYTTKTLRNVKHISLTVLHRCP